MLPTNFRRMPPSRPTKLSRSRHVLPTFPVFRAAQAVVAARPTPRAARTNPTRRRSRSLAVAVAVVVVEVSEDPRWETARTLTTPLMMLLPGHCATSARRRSTATARGLTRRIIRQHVERWVTAFSFCGFSSDESWEALFGRGRRETVKRGKT